VRREEKSAEGREKISTESRVDSRGKQSKHER
jgi:hypothetical protein